MTIIACWCMGFGEVALIGWIISAIGGSAVFTTLYNRYRCHKYNCQHNCHSEPVVTKRQVMTLGPFEFCSVRNVTTGAVRVVMNTVPGQLNFPVIIADDEMVVQPDF